MKIVVTWLSIKNSSETVAIRNDQKHDPTESMPSFSSQQERCLSKSLWRRPTLQQLSSALVCASLHFMMLWSVNTAFSCLNWRMKSTSQWHVDISMSFFPSQLNVKSKQLVGSSSYHKFLQQNSTPLLKLLCQRTCGSLSTREKVGQCCRLVCQLSLVASLRNRGPNNHSF